VQSRSGVCGDGVEFVIPNPKSVVDLPAPPVLGEMIPIHEITYARHAQHSLGPPAILFSSRSQNNCCGLFEQASEPQGLDLVTCSTEEIERLVVLSSSFDHQRQPYLNIKMKV
jgi:hypothetical protein